MMHSTLHFSLGMLVGMACTARGLWMAYRSRRPLHGLVGRALLLAYGLGIWAIVPNLLRRTGLPSDACEGWIMNIFLFSPWLNRMLHVGHVPGSFLLTVVISLQYAGILIAIRRAAHASSAPHYA